MSLSSNLRNLEQKAAGVLAVALPLSLVIFTHQRELTPLYGAAPTSFLLDKIIFAAIVASSVQPFSIPLPWALLASAIALTAAPNATYYTGVWTARRKDPVWGPAIAHVCTLGPIVFLLTTFVAEMEDVESTGGDQKVGVGRSPLVLRLVRGAVSYLISYTLAQRLWAPSPLFYSISDSQIYLAIAGVLYAFFIVSWPVRKIKASSRKKRVQGSSSLSETQIKGVVLIAFAAFWWTAHSLFANPILPHPLNEVFTHPSFNLQILSTEQSVTGLIQVAEWLPPVEENGDDKEMHSARYLRADHSILGGVWTRDKVQVLDDDRPLEDKFGNPLGDSIYSTFIIQEAVRLVNSTQAGKTNSWKNALVIGLGIGTSATSLMRHDVSTTIVEIDPAVYKAARTYFGLPDPGAEVFLEDARAWVAEKQASIEAGHKETLYDIVIHDCFSGGGVPEHIFTLQFWEQLKSVMASEGILVVNFAGILRSKSSRLVINTLERSFKQCRAFHDVFDGLPDEKYDTEFINMVIFCTQATSPLTFRKSRKSDWLGSPLRRHVFQNLLSREVNLTSIREPSAGHQYILTDENNPLGALQEKQGSHHWSVMREVLGDVHWETY